MSYSHKNPSFDCNGRAGAVAAPAVEIKAQIFIVAICRVYNQPPRSDSMAGSGGRGCCTHSSVDSHGMMMGFVLNMKLGTWASMYGISFLYGEILSRQDAGGTRRP